jgi:hypothetical protein
MCDNCVTCIKIPLFLVCAGETMLQGPFGRALLDGIPAFYGSVFSSGQLSRPSMRDLAETGPRLDRTCIQV